MKLHKSLLLFGASVLLLTAYPLEHYTHPIKMKSYTPLSMKKATTLNP